MSLFTRCKIEGGRKVVLVNGEPLSLVFRQQLIQNVNTRVSQRKKSKMSLILQFYSIAENIKFVRKRQKGEEKTTGN